MAYPEFWFGKTNIPWEINAVYGIKKTMVRLYENGKMDKLAYETKESIEPELTLTKGMKDSLIFDREESFKRYREVLYQKEEGNIYVLSQEQQLEGEKLLR